jgi:hypothetical protein
MRALRCSGSPVGVLAALVLAIVVTAAFGATPETSTCRLLEVGSDLLKSEDCLVCHRLRGCHPVEVVYREALARGASGSAWYLRPEDVAVSRGAYLPDGRVRCVTCHDRHSSAPSHLAVPGNRSPESPTGPGNRGAEPGCSPLCLECHPWRD